MIKIKVITFVVLLLAFFPVIKKDMVDREKPTNSGKVEAEATAALARGGI